MRLNNQSESHLNEPSAMFYYIMDMFSVVSRKNQSMKLAVDDASSCLNRILMVTVMTIFTGITLVL